MRAWRKPCAGYEACPDSLAPHDEPGWLCVLVICAILAIPAAGLILSVLLLGYVVGGVAQ